MTETIAPGGEINLVKRTDIYVGKRMREKVRDITDLITSIPKLGLINPITITPFDNEHFPYELVAGERRLLACEELDYDHIKCHIVDSTLAKEIELVENDAREGFTPLESILQTRIIHEGYVAENPKHTITATGKIIGKTRSTMTAYIKYAGLYLNAKDRISKIPEDEYKAQPDDFQWDIELVKAFEKATSFNDIAKAERIQSTSYRTRDLAAAAVESAKEVEAHDEQTVEQQEGSEGTSEQVSTIPLWKKTALVRIDKGYNVGDTFSYLAGYPDDYHNTCYWDIDPPYGIDYAEHSTDPRYTDAKTFKSGMVFYRKIISEMARISGPFSRAILWHGAEPRYGAVIHNLLRRAGWRIDPIPFIWIKTQGNTKNRNLYLPRAYETATIALGPEAEYFSHGLNFNYMQWKTPVQAKRFHPNAKPYGLIKTLYDRIFEFGSTASWFVPFAGGGAAVYYAAKLAPTHLYAADLQEDYKNKLLMAVQESMYETEDLGESLEESFGEEKEEYDEL